ncbi:uncharacterized protein LOC135473419 [Liolophura sinensis]|uniref:uncharacterized protein LOC135473419 n=1 Tax=Liolophura sinensis TaxID=3198878 RepID=UPI0031591990
MASAATTAGITDTTRVSETLEVCLTLMKEEGDGDTFSNAVETLFKIFSNAYNNPKEEKYRRLKKSNKTFHDKVWQYDGAQQFMLAVGCIEMEDSVFLPSDVDFSSALQILQQYHRSQSHPATENHSGMSPEQKAKSQHLEKERQKHLEQMRRMKEEKKRISDQIKADRKEIDTRETKASRARNITKGANIKRFEDIGVDLNRGGG